MPKLEDRNGRDVPVARFVITHFENGSLEVSGPIDNLEYAIACLENAKDAIRNHRSNRPLIVPSHDVSIKS